MTLSLLPLLLMLTLLTHGEYLPCAPQGSAVIFAGDFNRDSLPTESALRNHFNHFGTVKSVHIIASTGKAIIEFEDQADADRCVWPS